MELRNRLRRLLQNMLGGRSKYHRPPTHHEWGQLPDFVKDIIVHAKFEAENGIERDIFLAHWIR
jgi:hypothetical protein